MIVGRHETNVLRIQENGDVVIPAAFLRSLLTHGGTSDGTGIREDIEDFGPGRLVKVGLAEAESGTEITIERDRRKEAR